MQLFLSVNVDWMARKWIFLGLSLVLSVSGLASIFFWHGIPLGVDFRGGTIVYVKFSGPVEADAIRKAIDAAKVKEARIQRYDRPTENKFIIATEQRQLNEEAIESGKQQIVAALQNSPLAGQFEVFNTEIVGPQVGKQLQDQAIVATILSLAGMLVYLWFRFELVYGAAAVVAVFHDTLITLGIFSLTNTELSLTVIAALLTLIGYSMNDTIVVFDRIRENLKISRRDSMYDLVNRSINQTLSRTILTSGLTFLTVLALYLFGGPVLHGFSFALVIGILVGTYSSIAIAAPMLVAYQTYRAGKTGVRVPLADSPKAKAKARA
jgi:preprotein translocase subunit SecF